MNLSQNIIDTIERCASVYLPISDIAVIINVSPNVLRSEIADKSSPAHKAYISGKTKSKLKLLEQEMELAQIGSPQAIENVHKNLLAMEDDE